MNRQRTGFAVLDGKPKTPEQRQQAIEAELRALPELEAPGAVWQAIEQRLDAARRPERPYFRRALAAGFAAAALTAGALLFYGSPVPAPQQLANAVPSEAEVAALMERSRLVETRRRILPRTGGARLAAVREFEARRLLAARIASVDASLNRLATVGPQDPVAHERLWRERVELMDTLMRAEQVQREELIRRAVY